MSSDIDYIFRLKIKIKKYSYTVHRTFYFLITFFFCLLVSRAYNKVDYPEPSLNPLLFQNNIEHATADTKLMHNIT